ncbi:MAG: rod-binding protein [Desulfobulbaceae bacterium]|jgi:flagellar protein FlgJ|nr:rod-binding protein [Desulfobulbaceae bacterium]
MYTHIDPRTIISQAAGNISEKKTLETKTKNLAALRESCREFEAIFVGEMFKAMRKTVPDSGLVKKSMAVETYQEMLDMETVRKTTQGQGLGIGEAMYRQLAAHLEAVKEK